MSAFRECVDGARPWVRVAVLTAMATAGLRAGVVDIRTEFGVGGGLSVARHGECFVVTPLHVVEVSEEIAVQDENGLRTTGSIVRQFDGDFDLAVLRLEPAEGFACEPSWEDGGDTPGLVEKAPWLVSVRLRDGQSTERRRHFYRGREGSTKLRLGPLQASDALAEGDSGSLLYAEETLVGMVLSIDTATGEPIALRQDTIHDLVAETVLEQQDVVYLMPLVKDDRHHRVATVQALETMQELGYDARELIAGDGGEPVLAPADATFVLSGDVLRVVPEKVDNPEYRGDLTEGAARQTKKSKWWGRIARELGKSERVAGARYVDRYTIEIELRLERVATGERTVHLVRQETLRPHEEASDVAESIALEEAMAAGIPALLTQAGL